jgi:Heavy metal associated domain 2
MPKKGDQKVESSPTEKIPIQGSVVSCTSGRIRCRIAPSHRQTQTMQQIEAVLASHPQVHEVKANVKTGSILVHHDPENEGLANVLSVLKDIGVVFGEIAVPAVLGEQSVAAANLTQAIADLNQRVRKATGEVVDLRLIIPLLLLLLALRQVRRKGLQFDGVPWYVLAWYAFDSFVKLHPSLSASSTALPPDTTVQDSVNGNKLPTASKWQRAKP